MNSSSTHTILVVKSVYERVTEIFESLSDLDCIPVSADEQVLSNKIKAADPVAVVLDVDRYMDRLYEAMTDQMLIARFGVGCDGIDFNKASSNNLIVTNTPGVLEATVAEFTVFLAGEVLRMPGLSSNDLKQGHWTTHMGRELHGKTWAILGLGGIGRKVSQILSFGFNVKVHATKKDITDKEQIKHRYGVELLSTAFENVAPKADIISLHMPANKQTHHFMDRKRLQQLKPGAILINTARGALVDEEALYDLLKSGHIAAAGLDVFEKEPYQPIDKKKDLRELPNVFMTPHIASSATECMRRMAQRVVQNIRLFIRGEHHKMDIVEK
ncbi:MAG: NAD(P)-dependent oxidoreductase [Balneolaceae bacterium]|nr:NAD(P)-dependent oxidoreductase [Balneolaceae bacterium]